MPPTKKKNAKAQPTGSSGTVVASVSTSEVISDSALNHKNRGNELYSQHKYEEAITEYSTAIDMSDAADIDGIMKLYSNRSACYSSNSSSRHLPKALEDAEHCILLDSSWAKGYYRKGVALAEMGRLAEAKECLELGLAKQPENADIQEILKDTNRKILNNTIQDDMEEDSPDKDKFDELVEWLRAGNAQFPKLYMKRYAENYRGVHCHSSIDTDEVVMRIPRKYLITVEMGKECEIGRKMMLNNLDLSASKHCFLCVYVLTDRDNPSSFYQPYYRILPSQFANMPLFWSDEDLSWLEGSYILDQINERKINIKQDYDDICLAAPEFSRYSLSDFTWARLMVASRNFGIDIGDIKTDALVPYADMLNHKRPRQTRWCFDAVSDSFVITSLEPIGAGLQVYDSYGKKCNSRFLLNYGFSIASNRDSDGKCHNEVHISLSLPLTQLLMFNSDVHVNMIRSMLGVHGQVRSCRISNSYADKSSREAWSFARVYSCTPAELLSLPTFDVDYDWNKCPLAPISCENEIRVLSLLSSTCQEMLSRYPDYCSRLGLATEDDVINHFPPFSNISNSLVLVRGEKEICRHYVQLSEIALPLLSKPWRDVKKIINKNYSGDNNDEIGKYIVSVVQPLAKKKMSSNDGDA